MRFGDDHNVQSETGRFGGCSMCMLFIVRKGEFVIVLTLCCSE